MKRLKLTCPVGKIQTALNHADTPMLFCLHPLKCLKADLYKINLGLTGLDYLLTNQRVIMRTKQPSIIMFCTSSETEGEVGPVKLV